MDINSISYLLRYVFAIFIVVVAVKLLVSALKELRWSFRHSLRPAQGYFLLNQQSDGTTASWPLYHTTNIGRAKSNDLRIYADNIKRHHAVIYRYDGAWFIRPQSNKTKVVVNGEEIKEATKLENGDRIDFASTTFAFIDERSFAESRGEVYEESIYDDAAFYMAVERNSNPPYVEFTLLNLFAVLALTLIYFMMPAVAEIRKQYLIYTGAALLVIDLYFLLLPKFLRYADRILYLAAAQLSVIGMTIQARLNLTGSYSMSVALESGDQKEIIETANALFSGYRTQIIALLIGLGFLWLIALIVSRTRFLENIVVLCAILTPLFLIVTLVLGRGAEEHGATLWLRIGSYSLQLTEFAKITYLVTLAGFFKNRPPLKQQIRFAIWAAVVFILYLLLPDLGSLMILVPVTLLVFVVMTSEYLKTFLILVAASLLGFIGYEIFPHVKRRIDGWTSLWVEVNDSNRQIVYGLQAIGRGNIFGRGLGNGSPGGIPLVKSDMVFSSLCEEFGLLVGVCIVIILFVMLLRGVRTTILARDGFTSSLALGLSASIFIEAVVVIGGTTGLIPLTGATVPFIAAGGSSMIAKWFIVGILLGLSARHEEGASK